MARRGGSGGISNRAGRLDCAIAGGSDRTGRTRNRSPGKGSGNGGVPGWPAQAAGPRGACVLKLPLLHRLIHSPLATGLPQGGAQQDDAGGDDGRQGGGDIQGPGGRARCGAPPAPGPGRRGGSGRFLPGLRPGRRPLPPSSSRRWGIRCGGGAPALWGRPGARTFPAAGQSPGTAAGPPGGRAAGWPGRPGGPRLCPDIRSGHDSRPCCPGC